jgi:hypothetical protein
MPSAQDILDAINNNTGVVGGKLDTVNNNLTVIQNKLDAINASVIAVDNDVQKLQQLVLWGFTQLITLGQYTNQALFQNDKQNDTMICILQQISVNTCGIWNETHTETELQKAIRAATHKLAFLYASTHGDVAITFERDEELRRQIEACCPPEPPEPVCSETPCSAPAPFEQQPPTTQPPPQLGPPPTK